MMDIYTILIPIFFGIVVAISYWNTSLHKNKKFIYLVQTIGALGILLAVYNIYRNFENDKKSNANEKTRMFAQSMNNLINTPNTAILESKSPELNQYYLELLGIVPQTDKNTDTTSELLLTVNILSAFAQILEYIHTHNKIDPNSDLVAILRERSNRIMTQYVKSKKFVSYWKIYKEVYSGSLIIDYMASKFNL